MSYKDLEKERQRQCLALVVRALQAIDTDGTLGWRNDADGGWTATVANSKLSFYLENPGILRINNNNRTKEDENLVASMRRTFSPPGDTSEHWITISLGAINRAAERSPLKSDPHFEMLVNYYQTAARSYGSGSYFFPAEKETYDEFRGLVKNALRQAGDPWNEFSWTKDNVAQHSSGLKFYINNDCNLEVEGTGSGDYSSAFQVYQRMRASLGVTAEKLDRAVFDSRSGQRHQALISVTPDFIARQHKTTALSTDPNLVARLIDYLGSDKNSLPGAASPSSTMAAVSSSGPGAGNKAWNLERIKEIESQMRALVGLDDAVAQLISLQSQIKLTALKMTAGLHAKNDGGHHVLMVGPPGTGKTTLARLYGQWLHAVGILPTDNFLETSREDFVSGFMGQTPGKTQEVLNKAKGGMLFIDEAYSLVPEGGSGQDYGHEALALIIADMENNRGSKVVVMAGYPDKMEQLLATNVGVKSRFRKTVTFDDYKSEDLIKIFHSMMQEKDLAVHPEFETEVEFDTFFEQVVDSLKQREGRNFGNARTIRNIVHNVEEVISDRLDKEGVLDRLAGEGLSPEDLAAQLKEHLVARREYFLTVLANEFGVSPQSLGAARPGDESTRIVQITQPAA